MHVKAPTAIRSMCDLGAPQTQPDVIDWESILRREENRGTRRKTLGVRLRSTEARVKLGSQRWEARLMTTKPPWLPLLTCKKRVSIVTVCLFATFSWWTAWKGIAIHQGFSGRRKWNDERTLNTCVKQRKREHLIGRITTRASESSAEGHWSQSHYLWQVKQIGLLHSYT